MARCPETTLSSSGERVQCRKGSGHPGSHFGEKKDHLSVVWTVTTVEPPK